MSDASFDHLVVYVPNIAEASQQFSQLGFKVSYGGAHSHTHSALIIFSDQTYIELLALRPGLKRTVLLTLARSGLLDAIAKRKTDMSWRLMCWLNKPYGAIDWCLRTEDIDSLLESCRQNHYEVLKVLIIIAHLFKVQGGLGKMAEHMRRQGNFPQVCVIIISSIITPQSDNN